MRKLHIDEAILISHEIENTGNIIYYSGRELSRYKKCFIAEGSQGIEGCLIVSEGKSFVDIKILIVLSSKRRRGVGRQLFNAVMKYYQSTNKVIYLTTRNPIITKMASTKGFSVARLSNLPMTAFLYEIAWSFNIKRMIVLNEKTNKFPELAPFEYYILRPK